MPKTTPRKGCAYEKHRVSVLSLLDNALFGNDTVLADVICGTLICMVLTYVLVRVVL